jgi:hypothetical protein
LFRDSRGIRLLGMHCTLEQKGCKLCIYQQKEGSDFSLRITSGICGLPFSWWGLVPFVITVHSSHFFPVVTPMFLVTFSRRLEAFIFCVTKLIKTHYSRRKCSIFFPDSWVKDFEMLYSSNLNQMSWIFIGRLVKLFYNFYPCIYMVRGGAVGWGTAIQGRGFDSRWCHWNFSLT